MPSTPRFLWNYHRSAAPEEAEAGAPPLPPPDEGVVRVIPLGGLGEFGQNMMVYEYGDDIVAIDCGQMFPEEELPGVDMIVPDVSYLVERIDRVRGILLTHGHEDHIGGLPYILKTLPVPVYGAPFTLRLLKARLVEHGLAETADLREVAFRKPLRLGAFRATFIHVTHSIVSSASIALKTPAGTIVHSGDYKIDSNPPDGEPFDFYSFTRLGEEGVLALMNDSTNIESPGATASESSIIPDLERIFTTAPRAVIAATFSSSIHRIQTLLNIAREHGRTVFVTGLNLERNLAIARDMGYIEAPDGLFAPLSAYGDFPPERALVLTTGSQGEPLSALSRMALGDHRQIRLAPGDTVVLSARMIPGNEKAIFRMMNHFARHDVRVIYERVARVHVSGHGYSGELAQMIEMLNPRYLVPMHGESRHLRIHAEMARRMGYPAERVPVIENGDVLELTADAATVRGRLDVSRILVDGKSVGEVGEVVLRDRLHLGQDGMVVVFMTVDRTHDRIVTGPEIISRGFVYMEESEALVETLRQLVIETFEACDSETREDPAVLKEEVRRAVRRYLRKEFERFPMVLPVVMEI